MNVTATLEDPEQLQTMPPTGVPEHSPTPLGSQYVLEHLVGQGAFGQVWQGRRNSDGTPVAIKVPQATYSGDPEVVARFLRERTTLQGLSHPHLVTVYDLVVEGDTLAVVMEFVHGRDLRQMAKQGGLNVNDALTLLAQVAYALAHIHAAGVLHRDIKPENILLTWRDGQPWAQLTDFGLAWVADGKQLTGSSAVMGTPAYLAPELLTGRPYGPAVDIYSLGVTAYEILSGKRPFEADHPLALMRAHLDDQPKRPDGMPEGHWRIIQACLAKRPQERPTAAQLATHLDELRTTSSPRLAINLGTANTTAVLGRSDGRVEPLLFDGSPLLPSAIHAGPDGVILTGRAALNAARLQPQHFDPYPGLRLADPTVTMGKRRLSATDLLTAILRRVTRQAQRAIGQVPTEVTITHPPAWGPPEFTQVEHAAKAAGLPTPQFVAEAVAVAAHLAGSTHLPIGAYALLYDLGAATNTVSVVRRNADDGFELLASEYLSDAGGIDIDAAIFAHLGQRHYSSAPQQWRRLRDPGNKQDLRASWQLWGNVRQAKHTLSQTTSTATKVYLPLIDQTVPLERRQLDELAQPIIDRTVAAARTALASAGVATTDLAATFLTGGSSRIPQVTTLLRQALGSIPTPIEQPELAVAEGALHLTRRVPLPAPAPRALAQPMVVSDTWPHRSRARRRRRRGRMLPVAAAILVLVILASVVYASIQLGPNGQASAALAPCGYKIATMGSTPPPGPAIRAAVGLAVKQYNDVHPSCTLELVDFDTRRDSALSQALATDIVADTKIVGVIGPLGQREAYGALPVLNRGGVVTISPLLHEDNLADRGWRVFYRTSGTILGDDTPAGIRYLTQELKATKTFVIDEGDDESVAIAQKARQFLGAAFIGSASIRSPDIDFAPIVNQINRSGADSIYYAGYDEAIVPLLRQLRVGKSTITFLTGYWGYSAEAVAKLGSAANGIYGTSPGMALSLTNRGFADQIKANSTGAVKDDDNIPEAFDAARILLTGLAAGKTTRADMLTWVSNYDGNGVSGLLKFTPTGNRTTVPVYMSRVVDGSWKIVGRIGDGRPTP